MEKRKTAASEQTKRTLAAALKELMAQKPLIRSPYTTLRSDAA